MGIARLGMKLFGVPVAKAASTWEYIAPTDLKGGTSLHGHQLLLDSELSRMLFLLNERLTRMGSM
jgi:hypothetical protein